MMDDLASGVSAPEDVARAFRNDSGASGAAWWAEYERRLAEYARAFASLARTPRNARGWTRQSRRQLMDEARAALDAHVLTRTGEHERRQDFAVWGKGQANDLRWYICHAADGDDCTGPFPTEHDAQIALRALSGADADGESEREANNSGQTAQEG